MVKKVCFIATYRPVVCMLSTSCCHSCPSQLAEEFVVVAGDSEKCWTKTVQHERKLREDLEVNFEALATQMHGLEDQARRATRTGMVDEFKELEDHQQFVSPGLTDGTGGKGDQIVADTPSSSTLHGAVENFPYNAEGTRPRSLAMSDQSGDPVLPTSENGGKKEEEDDDDDDKFFDAPVEAPESAKPLSSPRVSGDMSASMECSVSSTSIMLAASPANVNIPPENLPAGVRMNVSGAPVHCLICHHNLDLLMCQSSG